MNNFINKLIFFLVFFSIFVLNQNLNANNSKIVFELNGKYYSTIDIENRLKYLKLINFNENISYQTAKIDFKSIILFDQFYLEKRIDKVNPEESYNEMFGKYINNEVKIELQKIFKNLDKNIILNNIKYDLQRRNIIEKNIQKNISQIFDNLETYNFLLYNYMIDYYILNNETYENLIKNNFTINELKKEELDNILINNDIKYLYKSKQVNDFENLDNNLKKNILIGKNFIIQNDSNTTLMLINKKLRSKNTVKFIINEITSPNIINEINLKCNNENILKNSKEVIIEQKKYKANKINPQIVDSLSNINDFVTFKTEGLYKYFVLCDYELDSNYLKDVAVRDKVNYFAELIELDFVNYYSKYFLINEL